MVQGIVLDVEEKEMLKTSMDYLINQFNGIGNSRLKQVYSSLKAPDFIYYLDEIDMIYISQSLFKYGKYLSEVSCFDESRLFRSLALELELIRIAHKNRILDKKAKKKAACAGTQTA